MAVSTPRLERTAVRMTVGVPGASWNSERTAGSSPTGATGSMTIAAGQPLAITMVASARLEALTT
jgi:hypothetical protein